MTDTLLTNEISIRDQDIAAIPVVWCSAALSRRHMLIMAAEAFQQFGLIALQDASVLYLVPTMTLGLNDEVLNYLAQQIKDFDPSGVEQASLASLPEELQRRLLFELIVKGAAAEGVYRAYHSTLFRPQPIAFQNQNAASLRMRHYGERWGVYLDPSLLSVACITGLDQLDEEPLLYLCQYLSQCPEATAGTHCPIVRPGHVGYWAGKVSDPDSDAFRRADRPKLRCRMDNRQTGDFVLVKPTRKSQACVAMQAFLLHRIVRSGKTGANPDSSTSFATNVISTVRFSKTQDWLRKVFPSGQLQVGQVQVPVQNGLSQPVTLKEPADLSSCEVYYPEVGLRFDPRGTSWRIVDQKRGLDKFGPYDQRLSSRPFKRLIGRVIVPDAPEIIRHVTKLMQFLSKGYAEREGTRYRDAAFGGMQEVFKVPLVFNADDILTVEPTVAAYEKAATDLAKWWRLSGAERGTIALVVVPSQYPEQDEWTMAEDPYLRVKALLLNKGLPSQMIEVAKLSGIDDTQVPFGHLLTTLALDMYVKVGGKPWTLQQPIENVNCFIGIGFGLSRERKANHIYVGVASVFDRLGEWLDIIPEQQSLSEEDYESLRNRSFLEGSGSYKIAEYAAYQLVNEALKVYKQTRQQRQTIQVRQIVIHKNGEIHDCEAKGFLRAISEHTGDASGVRFALVSVIKDHGIRLYGGPDPSSRKLDRTVTRGAVKLLDDNTAVVSTSGKILTSTPTKSWYSYHGMGTPEPIMLERYVPGSDTLKPFGLNVGQMYSLREIVGQALALTRLHWGTMRVDVRLPVTSLYAQNVAALMAQTDLNDLDLSQMSGNLWCV